jgi:nitroreductase
MNIIDAILKRQSIREFLPRSVDIDIIKKIINVAKYSPSGTNTQPWSVSVVTGDTKSRLDTALVKAFWNKIAKTPDYSYYPDKFSEQFQKRRIECGALLYGALSITKDDKEKRLVQWAKNYTSFQAPCTIYVFTDSSVNQGSFLDCGMFIQSIMLAALEYNLATCAQASLAEYPDIVRNILQINNDHMLLCGIAIGYANYDAKVNQYRTPREELDSFTTFYN